MEKFIYYSNSRRLLTEAEFKREHAERERKARSEKIGNGAVARILQLSEPQPAKRTLSAKEQQQVARLLHRMNGGQFNFANQPLSSNGS